MSKDHWLKLTAVYPAILQNKYTGDLYIIDEEGGERHRLCVKLPLEVLVHADSEHADIVNVGLLVRTLSTHSPQEEPFRRPIGYGLARYLQSNHGMEVTTSYQGTEAQVRATHLQELWRVSCPDPAINTNIIENIVLHIEEDLLDRRDIKHVLAACDDDVREEIRTKWRELIETCLRIEQ